MEQSVATPSDSRLASALDESEQRSTRDAGGRAAAPLTTGVYTSAWLTPATDDDEGRPAAACAIGTRPVAIRARRQPEPTVSEAEATPASA
jgi:hypothetical protein